MFTDKPSPQFWFIKVVDHVHLTFRVNCNGDSILRIPSSEIRTNDATLTYRTPNCYFRTIQWLS